MSGPGFLVQSPAWRSGCIKAFQVSADDDRSDPFLEQRIFSAVSYLIAVPIAERIGLINTMVFTHLPSNVFLMLISFAPDLGICSSPVAARTVRRRQWDGI